jgi:hypothetical protein
MTNTTTGNKYALMLATALATSVLIVMGSLAYAVSQMQLYY